jgi:DNA-binding PucR family transcriptional regulator
MLGLQAFSNLGAADREEVLSTLDLFFEHMGNAAEAARRLHLHPNSFRYRLNKISDILNVDLSDRKTRQLLELQILLEAYSDLGEG